MAETGGNVTLGVATDGAAGFVWDNEGPPAPLVCVAPFRVAAHPVTVAEFFRFAVEAGGYEDARWWNAEDLEYFKGRNQVWALGP